MSTVSLMPRPHCGLDSPRDDPRIQLHSRVALVLVAVLLLAFILRVDIAVIFPSASHPDETFQTREPAHRLAYGYGITAWEWRDGIRSWVFPAFLAGIMRATDWMGAGSGGYLLGIAIILSLISLTTVWFSFVWAYRTNGIVAAIIAAGASATWFELVYYGPRAMYEVVAAHVLLPGLYLGAFGESIPERRRLFISGLFLGLALALRPPLTPAVVFAAVAFGLKNPRVRLPAIAAGVLVPIVLFGIVDALTWPYPFHSFIGFFKFNIVQESGAVSGGTWFVEHEWIRPWYWFSSVLGLRLGPMALLALVGARRSPFLGWVALVILLTHSLVGHKEFRFIYPMIPIALTLAAVGVADMVSIFGSRWRSSLAAGVAGLALCVGVSASLAWFFPLWSRYSGNLIAFQELSRDTKVCGIALVGPQVNPVFSGGYTYLHKNVPIYFFRTAGGVDMQRLTPAFNAIVTALPLTYDGFGLTRCWNGTCLYRSQGSCTPSPGHEIKSLPVE